MFDGSTGADVDVVYEPRAEVPTGTSLHHRWCKTLQDPHKKETFSLEKAPPHPPPT